MGMLSPEGPAEERMRTLEKNWRGRAVVLWIAAAMQFKVTAAGLQTAALERCTAVGRHRAVVE